MARLALLLMLSSSCSFALARGPSKTGPAECTDDHTYTVADGVLAAGSVIAGAIVYRDTDEHSAFDAGRTIVSGASAIVALTYLLSAGYGADKVAACRKALR